MKPISFLLCKSHFYLPLWMALLSLIFIIDLSGQSTLKITGSYSYGIQDEMLIHPQDSTVGYLISGTHLLVLDLSNPLTPQEIYKLSVQTRIYTFVLVGDYLYLGTARVLGVYKITNKRKPTLIKNVASDDQVAKLYYDQDKLYQISFDRLIIYTIQNRENPSIISRTNVNLYLRDLAFKGNYMYALSSSEDKFITIYNLTNPAMLTSTKINLTSDYLNALEIIGPYLYVAARDSFYLFTLTNSAQPSFYKAIGSGWVYEFAVYGQYVFIPAQGYGIKIYNIANPGNPTYVTTGGNGCEKVRVRYPYFFAVSGAAIDIHDLSDPTHPQWQKSRYNPGGIYKDLRIVGTKVFVSAYEEIKIIDVSNAANPVFTRSLPIPAVYLEKMGNYLFTANRWSGWSIVDLTNNSQEIVRVPTQNRVEQIIPAGQYVYLADWSGGVQIYDIADKAHPRKLGQYTSGKNVQRIAVYGNYVYAFERSFGLKVIDVTNKMSPVAVDSIHYAYPISDLLIVNHYLFLTEGAGIILDLTNPAHPAQVQIELEWWANTTPAFAISKDTLFVLTQNNILRIFDVSDVRHHKQISSFVGPYRNTGIVPEGRHIYLLDEDIGLYLLEYEASTGLASENKFIEPCFIIYPNPVRQSLVIMFRQELPSGTMMIIYNHLGAQVYACELDPNRSSLQIPVAWPAGLYYVSIVMHDQRQTLKMIALP